MRPAEIHVPLGTNLIAAKIVYHPPTRIDLQDFSRGDRLTWYGQIIRRLKWVSYTAIVCFTRFASRYRQPSNWFFTFCWAWLARLKPPPADRPNPPPSWPAWVWLPSRKLTWSLSGVGQATIFSSLCLHPSVTRWHRRIRIHFWTPSSVIVVSN